MVNSLKCDTCTFASKCKALAKLKPFLDEAKVDLGVELTFVDCVDYQTPTDDAE